MSNAFDLTVHALRKQGLDSDEILEKLSGLFQKLADSVTEYDNEFVTDDPIERKIKKLLDKVCVPKHIKGYLYWVEAIRFYKQSNVGLKMKKIYDYVAEKYEDTPSKTARAMRFAIEKAFDKCPANIIVDVFGENISSKTDRPTNLQFMESLAEQI